METLGDIQRCGEKPTTFQIHMLELEESKKCREFNYVHRYHCIPMSNDQLGRPVVHRTLCWQLQALWRNLEEMFPGIEIDKS